LAGYEDLNDAIRLASDPTFWLMGSKIKTGGRLVKHACYYWLLGESFRVLAGGIPFDLQLLIFLKQT
jgi:hypothetical protein